MTFCRARLSWVKTGWALDHVHQPGNSPLARAGLGSMSWPPKVTVPVRGSMPEIALSSVLLPAPLGAEQSHDLAGDDREVDGRQHADLA